MPSPEQEEEVFALTASDLLHDASLVALIDCAWEDTELHRIEYDGPVGLGGGLFV